MGTVKDQIADARTEGERDATWKALEVARAELNRRAKACAAQGNTERAYGLYEAATWCADMATDALTDAMRATLAQAKAQPPLADPCMGGES